MKQFFVSLLAVILSFLWSVAVKAHAMLFDGMVRRGLILCSVYLPNGSTISIATGYGAAKTMSAVSNGNYANATLEASHGISNGDFMEVTSGWSRLNKRVVRASSVGSPTADIIELEGINSTSTTRYPAGSGVGSVREISGWQQITQIMDLAGDGGEQQFVTFQFLEADAQRRLPTFKSPVGITMQVADDDTLAGYLLLKEANDDRDPRAVKVVKPNGGLILFSAYVTLAPMPNLTVNQVATVQATFSLENEEPTKYAS